MNQGAGTVLRQWPASGNWFVTLGRSAEREFICTVFTGYRNDPAGDFYMWGFRRVGQEWAVTAGDKNPSAVAGNELRIVIDGTQMGEFAISKRMETGGMHVIRATISEHELGPLSQLLVIGGEIKVITNASTYTASLRGMSLAFRYMNDCLTEAVHMRSATNSVSR